MILKDEPIRRDKKRNILTAVFLVFFLSSSFLFLAPRPAHAMMPVIDAISNTIATAKDIWDKVEKALDKIMPKLGTVILDTAIRNTLNTIAYDSATYLGSGNDGQKPLWLTDNFGTTMTNVGDQAAGQLISSLDKKFGVNLCQPTLSAKIAIGLGLAAQQRPPSPDCTWTQLSQNWENTIAMYSNRKDFTKQLVNMFDVTGGKTDLSAALSLQTNLQEVQIEARTNQALQFQAQGLFLDKRNVAGTIQGVPDSAQENAKNNALVKVQNLLTQPADPLTGAAQLFINQYAVTAFQHLMNNLTQSLNQPESQKSITNPYAQPASGGIAAVKNAARTILGASFQSKTDYDILQQLSVCNTGVFGGVGPTDCVIDQGFSQAIENRKTVGEALDVGNGGTLDGTKPFGVFTDDSKPQAYQVGYPLRSISILRKYRIVPVGWELAAQYIQAHYSNQDVHDHSNLKDLAACFDPNDSYHGYNNDGTHNWCKGLIDPNWVLKAPQNKCVKEGYGPQILSGKSVPAGVDTNGKNLQEDFQVVRSDSYCSDEQSCIKENDDGSCQGNYFGYCTQDKRLWRFGSSGSCNEQFNTCQTFTNSQGNQVSYLKNSLQYCDSSQLGCHEYAIASPEGYDVKTGDLSWLKNSGSIFLNKSAGTCDQENEGCHEFIRTSSGNGTNLIADSNFDNDMSVSSKWTAQGNVSLSSSLPGSRDGQAIYVDGNASAGIYSFDHSNNSFQSVLPAGLVMEPEVYYTFSADVYLQTGDSVSIGIGRNPVFKTANIAVQGQWQTISITTLNNKELAADEIGVFGVSAGGAPIQFYIDNVKFEVSSARTAYSDYHSNNLVYEKFMPAYLRYFCYTDPDNGDFSSKTDAAPCNQYARQCNRDEVGCDKFTNNDNPNLDPIPAAITDVDVCDKSCDGYNTYIQSENIFSTAHVAYFIPSTAQACSSNSVGCQEFTSLASSTAGGEQKEYYSELRQCVKPTDPGANCQDFYTWEGTASAGQQLVKYSLQANGAQPATTIDDSLLCDASIFGTNPLLPAHNFDCRQFYDKAGNIYYHLYSKTITCSLNCVSYRMTEKDKIDNIFNNVDCSAASGFWDGAASVCYSCKNGGIWDANQNACVYQAIPSESAVCSASEKGCAKYDGNGGANTRTVLNDTFEGGATNGWGGGALSNASYSAGGHSFQFTNANPVSKLIGLGIVFQGSSYILTFLAKTDSSNVELSAELNNGTEVLPFDKTAVVKSAEWQIYTLNLPVINQAVTDREVLSIKAVSGTDNVYIDNIRLIKITDLYYLIKDSWKTPEICDEDTNKNPYPLFALGCASYSDHLGVNKYLHSFDHICQETAVGCEAMIDTHNSVSADGNSYGPNLEVASDSLIYVAYDQKYFCTNANQGCERLGLKNSVGGEAIYQDVYLKNNAEKYGTGVNAKGILCDQSGIGCDVFTYTLGGGGQSSLNFKDPGDQVCEWRQSPKATTNNGWGWFKKKVTRCGGIGDLCTSDKDCSAKSCLLEKDDTPCPVESLKTIGQEGGLGNEVMQPGSDGVYQWAGFCPDTQSSCTEYIDPVSDFSDSVVYNSDFTQNIGGGSLADSWNGNAAPYTQNINLEGGTLYVFAVQGNNSAVLNTPIPGSTPFHVLKADNTFADPVGTVAVAANSSLLFYTDASIKQILVQDASPNNNTKIILRKAAISYQLLDSVDKKDCSAGVNPSGGCVYFNERSVKGVDVLLYNPLEPTNMDPWASYNINGINSGVINLANNLIKVTPDRDCAQWLACKSYVTDQNGNKTCFDIANCNRLVDKSTDCANFTVANAATNRVYDPSGAIPGAENSETIKNLTGYVRVGYPSVDELADLKIVPNDLLNFGLMTQKGNSVIVPNGDFELFVATTTPYNTGENWVGNPASWVAFGNARWTKDTADSFFSVIADLPTAQNFGFSSEFTNSANNSSKSVNTYPVVGKAFLRYNATTDLNGHSQNVPFSSLIYVKPGQKYYLSYYIDTFKLKSDASNAEIYIIDGGGNVISSSIQGFRDGWVLKTQEFTATDNIVRILLSATPNSSGNVFIDDLQISPVLLARLASSYFDESLNKSADIPNLYDRQTCRLYPQEDSLSCNYFDSAGVREEGNLGYCLQYDKAPGNPHACIQWWPIDEVKGQGAQANASSGYNQRSPLYYCTGLSDRPYIDAANFFFDVDERFSLEVNGENVLSHPVLGVGQDCSSCVGICLVDPVGCALCGATCGKINGSTSGNIGDYLNGSVSSVDVPNKRIYLNYGQNTIKVIFSADGCVSGDTRLNLSGNYVLANGGKGELDIGKLLRNANSPGYTGPKIDITSDRGYGQDQHNINTVVITDGQYCGNSAPNGYYVVRGDDPCDACLKDENATITYNFSITPICGQIANVVDAYGRNKAWAERVRNGSPYELTCNKDMPDYFVDNNTAVYVNPLNYAIAPSPLAKKNICTSTAILSPFGSANPPASPSGDDVSFVSNPPYWSKPLPYWSPDQKTDGFMGQLYNVSDLQYLFARSYGVWDWSAADNSYVQNFTGENWSAPINICDQNIRNKKIRDCSNPALLADECNCAIPPTVSNITLNDSVSTIIYGHGLLNLAFNYDVDAEQAPLSEYSIDWGDGEPLNSSGADTSGTSKRLASHIYDYYDLLNKYNSAGLNAGKIYPTLLCDDKKCTVKPRIKIVDNWDWCTEGGISGQPCPTIDPDGGRCMNSSSRVTNGDPCWSNFNCKNSSFPVCADGWWEALGKITVFNQY